MAKDPAFLFYYNQWIGSTQGMDPFDRGCYIQLLSQQASNGVLPSDLDELAVLAGIKPSQYQRFEQGWKRTLEAKFEALDGGGFVNRVLENHVQDRIDYTKKQKERGTVGYFVKLAKKLYNIPEAALEKISKSLYDQDLLSKNKKEREECFKRTLEAYASSFLVNVNVNKDISISKGKEDTVSTTEELEEKRTIRISSSQIKKTAPGEEARFQIDDTPPPKPTTHPYLDEFCKIFHLKIDNPSLHIAVRTINYFLESLDSEELEYFQKQTKFYFKLKEINKQSICNWRTWIQGQDDRGPLWREADYEAKYLLDKSKIVNANSERDWNKI